MTKENHKCSKCGETEEFIDVESCKGYYACPKCDDLYYSSLEGGK